MNKKTVETFTVVKKESFNHSIFRVILKSPKPLLEVRAGQFANLDIPDEKDVFLRRPFSFLDADYSNNTLSFLIKVAGKGSRALAEMDEGEKVSVVYPLGKGFSMPTSRETILCIGGGSGIAPMLQLVKNSGLPLQNIHVLLGFRSLEEAVLLDEYQPFASFHYTTNDGSLGEKGLVTEHSIFRDLHKFDRIYTCGPLPMMKAIASVARRENIFCEVSLENLMACGFGVCLCCIEPTVKGNQRVCSDGPVFNINDLKW